MSVRHRRAWRVAERAKDNRPRLYLESSAVIAAVIEFDTAAMQAIRGSQAAASVLTFAECRRALARAVHSGRISSRQAEVAERELQRIETDSVALEITDTILARVGRRFPAEPVRTLDAIHLATAELIDDPTEPVTLLTRDLRIRENAELLGLRVA